MRDEIFKKASVARRLLDNDDFKEWFGLIRKQMVGQLEVMKVSHANQFDSLEALREFQGHIAFKQRLVKAVKAADKRANPSELIDRV